MLADGTRLDEIAAFFQVLVESLHVHGLLWLLGHRRFRQLCKLSQIQLLFAKQCTQCATFPELAAKAQTAVLIATLDTIGTRETHALRACILSRVHLATTAVAPKRAKQLLVLQTDNNPPSHQRHFEIRIFEVSTIATDNHFGARNRLRAATTTATTMTAPLLTAPLSFALATSSLPELLSERFP